MPFPCTATPSGATHQHFAPPLDIRGADETDFDPRRIRETLAEIAALEVETQTNGQADPHAPVIIGIRQIGTLAMIDGKCLAALHGITGEGQTFQAAAAAWITTAKARMAYLDGEDAA